MSSGNHPRATFVIECAAHDRGAGGRFGRPRRIVMTIEDLPVHPEADARTAAEFLVEYLIKPGFDVRDVRLVVGEHEPAEPKAPKRPAAPKPPRPPGASKRVEARDLYCDAYPGRVFTASEAASVAGVSLPRIYGSVSHSDTCGKRRLRFYRRIDQPTFASQAPPPLSMGREGAAA